MYTHSKFDHEFDHDVPTTTSIVMASTPRCGSSLMCEAFCLLGVAGAPTEFFDEQTESGFCAAWNCQPGPDYLRALLSKKTTANGVFGFKSHFHQYRRTFGLEQLPDLPNLKFILLTRQDKVRQAVSYSRAIQTNQWAAMHRATDDAPKFDFDQISNLVTRIQREERQWKEFFAQHSIEPVVMVYEEFSREPFESAKKCLGRFDIQCPEPPWPELTLTKQSDDLSEQWVQQFQQHQSQSSNATA